MAKKTTRKDKKPQVKVRDMKPKKDARGGYIEQDNLYGSPGGKIKKGS